MRTVLLAFFIASVAMAQNTGRGSANRPPELPTSTYANAYPQRSPGDPAQIARGKEIFEVNCAFCHGSDARGGDGGPNLIRAQIVLTDDKGETIAPVVREGRAAQGMPK